MLHLLLINISENHCSQIIKSIETEGFNVDYLILENSKEVTQELVDNSYWDAVILSEDPTSFTLLPTVAENFPGSPIIFFTENLSEESFKRALNQGANDCVSALDLYRLPKILQRELSTTTSKFQEETITNSSELLSDILNLSTENVFVFDAETLTCQYINQTAKDSLGYSNINLEEITPSVIYPEYNIKTFTNLVQPLLEEQRKSISLCTNIVRGVGVIFPAEILFTKISYDDNSFILAINKDISDTWYKVRKLQRQREITAKYLNKHKQKEELLVNAAHDMRTSLQSIILSNKLLFDKQPGDFQEGFSKFQQAIHFSGKHLLNYINEFFDPSNNNETSKNILSDSLDLDSFAQKIYLVFNPIAQRNGIDFHYDTSSLQQSYISTNQTYVKRILKNLLSNAFKFTNQGSVTFNIFSVTNQELANIPIDTENAVAFRVKDTGIGIPKSQLKKIFGRYNRTKNSKEGTGLGLDICQKLTKSIGGVLQVESEVEKGSVFTLYLPAHEKLSDKSLQNQQTNIEEYNLNDDVPLSHKNKTILVIDDSEVHNLAIKEYLTYTFANCIAVNTLEKAYQVLEDNHIDCIVTDYVIRDTNSLNFLKQIKNDGRLASIPTVVYTGKKLSDEERNTLLSYANGIVKKSYGSYDILVNTISSLLKQDSSNNYLFSD
ncbi:hypothetical protein CK503_05870 [Aliifodinibius salipaludis]|uniref:histidine kinase n=1 Tax=Fodinibius salipaludis TaxID=2032627 RepID=A0A2A2GCB0_9BACT|nr:ATP-binding protein [Aliifodinibius salipaludis]PAU94988.1 hypothetical protein CK503_05870 [Aliifodinibius salipaludis]